MFLAERARWTSAKLVVQYPKLSTKPSPNTTPIQLDISGLVGWWMLRPCQACRPGFPSALTPLILCSSPDQPPTECSPTMVSGISAAQMMKNWRTSL